MKNIHIVLLMLLASSGYSWAQSDSGTLKGYLYKVDYAIPGHTVYICGQRPFDTSGNLVGSGDLAAQTTQVFENLKTALATVNMSMRDVTQVTYLVRDVTSTVPGQVSAGPAQAITSLASAYVPTAQIVSMKNVPQSVRSDVFIEVEVITIK